jgi:hypothetical protein
MDIISEHFDEFYYYIYSNIIKYNKNNNIKIKIFQYDNNGKKIIKIFNNLTIKYCWILLNNYLQSFNTPFTFQVKRTITWAPEINGFSNIDYMVRYLYLLEDNENLQINFRPSKNNIYLPSLYINFSIEDKLYNFLIFILSNQSIPYEIINYIFLYFFKKN